MPSDAAEIGRSARMTASLLGFLAVSVLALAGVVTWVEYRDEGPYAPLHYSEQAVTSRVDGHGGLPAVRLGDTVNVTAEKCSDDPVDIVGVTSWKPVDPLGPAIITGNQHGYQRPEGCVVAQYQNDIPPEVAAAVRRQHDRGISRPLWVIQGAETPISPDGHEGSTEVWSTEPFAILERG